MNKFVKATTAVLITIVVTSVIYTQSIFGAEFTSAEELIKTFEGFRGATYICPAGVKTIGYGFTDKDLVAKDTITREEADKALSRKVKSLQARIIVDLNGYGRKLTKNELAALTSFVYNVGWHNWMSSTMRERLICGDQAGAAEEFPRWEYAGGKKLVGLIRRRAAEKRTFKRG